MDIEYLCQPTHFTNEKTDTEIKGRAENKIHVFCDLFQYILT